MLFIAPCHPIAKLKTYGERSLQHAAPTEENILPLVIRDSPSLAIFKSRLKTFLFKSALISISYVDSVKYLGFKFVGDHTDDNDILRQMRTLYARSNRLLRIFIHG